MYELTVPWPLLYVFIGWFRKVGLVWITFCQEHKPPYLHLLFTNLTYPCLSPRLPKPVNADDSYPTEPEQEEIIQPERTLQKVPNSSSPLSRNHLWSSVTPGFYSDSPRKTWPQEDYNRMSASDDGLSIQVSLVPSYWAKIYHLVTRINIEWLNIWFYFRIKQYQIPVAYSNQRGMIITTKISI